MKLNDEQRGALSDALGQSGLRSTRQREHIFTVLMEKRDHPTADEVYIRARGEMPSISLATVYNCLETLVACGLVKQVNCEREPTRYCPNVKEHAHFHDHETGRVYDIDLPDNIVEQLKALVPEHLDVETFEISFRGKPRKI